MGNLSLSLLFNPILTDGTSLSSPQSSQSITLLGTKGTKYNKLIGSSDGTFDLDEVTTIGVVQIANRGAHSNLSVPTGAAVVSAGTPGSTSYSYKVVAVQDDGLGGQLLSAASSVAIITTGNATLDSSNYNVISWNSIDNISLYYIYRTASAGTPSSTGLIATATTNSFNDQGSAGDSTTPPTNTDDNIILIGHTSGTYTIKLKGGEVFPFRWNQAALHHKCNTRSGGPGSAAGVPCEITILDD
jgi:hypothetical protein